MIKWRQQLYMLRELRGGRSSLRIRLLFFALLFVAILFIAVLIVLYATGVLSGNYEESYVYFNGEADYISAGIADSLHSLEMNAIKLSRSLGEILSINLDEKRINPAELQAHPEELEDLLRSGMEPLISSLVGSRSSGVFLALDATVNPGLAGAESSRAGLLLRNMMPNALDADPSIYFIRGPITLAREKNLYVVAQWDMEISLTDDYFRRTLDGARMGSHDLSRLVYLSPAITLPNDYSYQAILLCAPVLASDGTPLGVCGYEIDSLFFKTLYKPKDSFFPHMISLLAPLESGYLDMERGLIAADARQPSTGALTLSRYNEYFTRFDLPGSQSYIGLTRPIEFYPRGALHGSDAWSLAVMTPEAVMNEYIEAQRGQVLLILFIFLLFSIAAAAVVGHGYFTPLRRALKEAKASEAGTFDTTHITELDELIALVTRSSPDIEDKMEQMGLTAREREVCVMLLKAYSLKQIAAELHIAYSTANKHYTNLYRKLEISSRAELFQKFGISVFAGIAEE